MPEQITICFTILIHYSLHLSNSVKKEIQKIQIWIYASHLQWAKFKVHKNKKNHPSYPSGFRYKCTRPLFHELYNTRNSHSITKIRRQFPQFPWKAQKPFNTLRYFKQDNMSKKTIAILISMNHRRIIWRRKLKT